MWKLCVFRYGLHLPGVVDYRVAYCLFFPKSWKHMKGRGHVFPVRVPCL
jgi:hypothetical protein